MIQALPATADIYQAGPDVIDSLPGGSGTPPVSVPFLPGVSRTVSFPRITGTISACCFTHGSDGGVEANGTDITELNGISGIRYDDHTLFLVGVFLPAPDSSPPAPDVSAHNGNAEQRPALGELFAIGDGRTTRGAVQRFAIPAGATRLYVGFADAWAFHGSPGWYDDNTGTLSITTEVS